MKAKSFWMLFIVLILSANGLFGIPVITGINPAVGPASGGTMVSITGSGFTGATAVNFDAKPALGFIVNSDNLITAISPAHAPQVILVNVTTPSGTSIDTPDAFYTFQGDWQAYIANSESNNVSVINTTSNIVVATPMVGAFPEVLAITPDGTKTYVANFNSNSISIIDTATNLVLAAPIVGIGPDAIAITPDGTKVYVANSESSSVSVINNATNTVIATIPVGVRPSDIAITPDGTKAYVTNQSDNTVSVIDIASNVVIATIPVGTTPIAVVITPDGTKAYVVNQASNNISVISTASNTVIAMPTVGTRPIAIAITPDGTRVYVVNLTTNNVSVIETLTNTVIATIPVGTGPIGIAISPDGTKVYVTNQNSNSVSIISTISNTLLGSFIVGMEPVAVAITPNGAEAYIVNANSNNVSVINTANNITIATIPVGTTPIAISITPDQAPLAKFTFSLAQAGLPSTFNALASVSPVGTIVNYFWNFGDGTTLNTPSPIISHTYATPGAYAVNLTVTNSAGTSTRQIFSPSASLVVGTNNTAITHNGGPTATTTQVILIPGPPPPPPPVLPLPPRNLRAKQIEDKFATQTDIVNILTWKAPIDGATPVAYQIYRNPQLTKLVATIPANGKLRFKDHNRKEDRTYTYFVVTIDQAGNRSIPAVAVIKGEDE